MKWKTALSMVVALLGFAVLAQAVAPAPPGANAPAACSNMSSAGGAPMLRAQSTAEKFLSTQICGSCSRSPCQGAIIGQACYLGLNRGWGTCQSPYGNNCSDGIQWQCQCWSGPLP
jgi:hypothetical protein